MLHRRKLLRWAAGSLSMGCLGVPTRLFAATPPKKTRLGVCLYSYMIRLRTEESGDKDRALADPLNFLDHCHRLGAGGVQVGLGTRDQTYTAQLRRRAEEYGMFLEGTANLPRDRAELERFTAQVRTAKEAGADVIRVVTISGRRYERFDNVQQFRQAADQGLKSLRLAEPVAARHRVRLAVENHKDRRIDEMCALMKQLDSQYVGLCVDTGNSIALLEDPMEVVRAYAPWAHSVHLKDMALEEYDDGFLLAEVPLGQGILDLPEIVALLRRANPRIHFTLEMITRDPLRVPCLRDKYWATFGDVPGRDLARTLRTLRAHRPPQPLPRVSHLSLEEQVRREEDNVKKCLRFARDLL